MGLNEKFFKSADEEAGPFFHTVLYTGNATARAITGVGFAPDLVWVKKRNSASNSDHLLFDTVRGVDNVILSNSTQAEYQGGGTGYQSSFDTDGFSITGNGFINSSGNTFVSWCWKAGDSTVSNTDGSITSQVSANVNSGFSIVKWTGSGNAGQTVGHGLSDAPELIITKVRNINGESWYTYSEPTGNNKYLRLNSTSSAITAQQAGYSSGASFWNNTSPTNDVFSLGNIAEIMSYNHIAYCFHSVAGVSKVGSYTGTGNNMTVNVGFEPAFVMIKNTTDSASWHIFDNKRTTANPSTEALFPNEGSVAADYNTYFEFTNNGFNNKQTSTSLNKSGSTYVYYAIAIA